MVYKINLVTVFKHRSPALQHTLRHIAFLLPLFFLAPAASAASFACEKASTKVEKAICANPKLSKLDEVMAEKYRTIKSTSRAVVLTQRDWLKYQRNRCVDDECLVSVYNVRIERLRNGNWDQVSLPIEPRAALSNQRSNVAYETSPKKTRSNIIEWLQQAQVLENTFKRAKAYYPFASNLRIYAMECNEMNAFYYESKSAIVICYELIGALVERANALKREQPTFNEARHSKILQNSIAFVLLHELGHAALRRSESNPGLGPEELEADNFASILMLDFQGNSLDRMDALFGVNSFVQIAKSDPTDFRTYSDEHFLPGQRYVNFVCLTLGSDGTLGAPLLSGGSITVQRARGCPAEWRIRRQAVIKLGREAVHN